jgi:branched-chain amino acid aminotransferase
MKSHIEIQRVEKSKIDSVDFNNLPFGSVFSDHMLTCDFKDGAWQTPTVQPYSPIVLDPSAKIFHYGQSIFEGMKAYKDSEGKIMLFRPLENCKRLNKSAERLVFLWMV